MKTHNKLVRDKIIQDLRMRGVPHKWHRATPEEYVRALFQKLVEEAKELEKAKTAQEQMEEMGDVLEVLSALQALFPKIWSGAQKKRARKRLDKGAFRNRIILEES